LVGWMSVCPGGFAGFPRMAVRVPHTI
jgi:hypothetical protein